MSANRWLLGVLAACALRLLGAGGYLLVRAILFLGLSTRRTLATSKFDTQTRSREQQPPSATLTYCEPLPHNCHWVIDFCRPAVWKGFCAGTKA